MIYVHFFKLRESERDTERDRENKNNKKTRGEKILIYEGNR